MTTELFQSEFVTRKGSRAVIRVTAADHGLPQVEVTLPDQARPGPFTGVLTSQSDGTMKFEAGTRRDLTRVTIPTTVAAELGAILHAHRDRRSARLRAEIVEGVAQSARETVPDPTFGLEEWLENRGM